MHRNEGFSLVELMVAMAVMLLISGAAVTALLKMTSTQATIWNRTQMHSGIRGATEVLQQEIGQAGRIALPNTIQLAAAVGTGVQTVAVSCTGTCASGTTAVSGLFGDATYGEKLTIDAGCADTANPCSSAQEVVQVTAVNTTAHTITANFAYTHASGAPVQVFGGFAAGVVPSTTTNGSSGSVLKLFGDINGDGNMVYVEYSVSPACICSNTCNPSTTTGNLYRNSIAFDATSKPSPTSSNVLLGNIVANPGGTACFSYQPQPLPTVNGVPYVLDVAITLTVQTQQIDPITKNYQTETKALLNVAPRNVFNAWELATLGITDRIQSTPPTVTSLLP